MLPVILNLLLLCWLDLRPTSQWFAGKTQVGNYGLLWVTINGKPFCIGALRRG